MSSKSKVPIIKLNSNSTINSNDISLYGIYNPNQRNSNANIKSNNNNNNNNNIASNSGIFNNNNNSNFVTKQQQQQSIQRRKTIHDIINLEPIKQSPSINSTNEDDLNSNNLLSPLSTSNISIETKPNPQPQPRILRELIKQGPVTFINVKKIFFLIKNNMRIQFF